MFSFYINAQPYADKTHGLYRLSSDVTKISLVFFSVDKCPAKTLSLFILTKWIKSIFSANQKVTFLRNLQIATL